MNIKIDDLNHSQIIALLQEHLDDMYATSPPESVHALDIEKLKQPHITFYSAWENETLLGCIAISKLSETHGEIKSMRTSHSARGRGVASRLLQHVIESAFQKHITTLSLETGTQDYFSAARNLYRKFGFIECGPFANYTNDPHSCFMTLNLHHTAECQ